MKLFIGNVSYNTSESSLRSFFEEFGPLLSVKIATDRDTGRSRGFGFIEFGDRAKGEEAMSVMNGKSLDGKQLTVNEAKPKENNSSGRTGGGYSGGRSNTGYSGGRW